MRYGSVALKTFLATRAPFWQADLFTFTLASGTVYRWTTSDRDISVAGAIWSAVGPVLTRTGWSVKNTMTIASMTLKLFSTGTDFGGINIKSAIHNGLLDGAVVSLRRVIMPTFGDTSLGPVDIFTSRVSTVTVTALGADIVVKGGNVALQQYAPKNTYQLGCIHALYNAGCTLVRTAHQETHTVTTASTIVVQLSSPSIDPALFLHGTVLVTSGAAAGSLRTIKSVSSSGVGLAYPLYVAPQLGDTAVLTQGCNHSLARCSVFGNTAHYRGFPFIPPVETAF